MPGNGALRGGTDMKKRIWELDFFRGVFLWGMIGIHLIYDLVDLYGVLDWDLPR